MNYQTISLLFLSLLVMPQQWAMNQAHYLPAKTISTTDNFIMATALSCCSALLAREFSRTGPTIKETGYAVISVDKLEAQDVQQITNPHALQQYNDELKNKTEHRDALYAAWKQHAPKLGIIAFCYYVLHQLRNTVPSLANFQSQSWKEALLAIAVAFAVPYILGWCIQKGLHHYNPKLVLTKVQQACITVFVAVATYYISVKAHQHFQPYIIPTFNEHCLDCISSSVAPTIFVQLV